MKSSLRWMVLLLLVGGILYTAALDYGRPLPEYSPSTVQKAWLNGATVYHPDAFAYVGLAYELLIRHSLNPRYYDNPSLNIYTNMALFWVSGALGLPHHAEYGTREIAPFSLYVMAEFLSALFSLLTVALAYTAGRVAFDGRVGLATAALVTLSPLSTQHAHYATPNAETITLSTAAILLAFIILKQRQPTWITYLLGGLLVGLTMAGRYNAVIVGVVTGLAMLTSWWRRRKTWPLALGLAAMPVGFFIGTPGAVFASVKFMEDVRHILAWYGTGGGPGWTTTNALFYYWRYTLLLVVGPVAAIAALLGLAVMVSTWRRDKRWREVWIGAALALYLLIYSVIALSSKRLNANLLLPLILPMALLAARGAIWLWQKAGRTQWATVGLAALLLAWPAYLSVQFAQLLATPDTRLLAQAWIYRHVPKGTTVQLLGSYNVPLDPLDYHAANTYAIAAKADDPLWNSPIIVYSDAGPFTARRDPALTENPADMADMETTANRLRTGWIELVRFPRLFWPGQNIPPDDVSLWHQMEIVIYCNPANCPVSQPTR